MVMDFKNLPSVLKISPDQVQVLDEKGKEISIPDYDSFMQFLMLASLASSVSDIREYIEDLKPSGRLINYVIQVTATRQRIVVTDPAQSISIMNDGPNNVAVWINQSVDMPRTVSRGETYHIDFDTHQLLRFYIQCNPGERAQVRATVLG